jgi:D-alanyl-D-alanine carboxypeptidase
MNDLRCTCIVQTIFRRFGVTMSEFYASEKEKIVFDSQQIKPSLCRRWVFAFSVALLVSQTFLYPFSIPIMTGASTSTKLPEILPESSNIIGIVENQSDQNSEGYVSDKFKGELTPEEMKPAMLPALKEDIEKGLLILVNKQNPLASDYKPSDLADIKYFASNRAAGARYMRVEAADAFNKLSEAAADQGLEIVVTTAYRSYAFQSMLYNNYVANYGQASADTFSAQPGKSEHQTGLAADVSSPSVNYELTEGYIDTPEGGWLNENAYKFGFIIRYPKGKEDITGYMYEPWHIRYVGMTAAEEIYKEGITLEEYLENDL